MKRHIRTHIHVVAHVLEERTCNVITLQMRRKLKEVLRVILLGTVAVKYDKTPLPSLEINRIGLVCGAKDVG